MNEPGGIGCDRAEIDALKYQVEVDTAIIKAKNDALEQTSRLYDAELRHSELMRKRVTQLEADVKLEADGRDTLLARNKQLEVALKDLIMGLAVRTEIYPYDMEFTAKLREAERVYAENTTP